MNKASKSKYHCPVSTAAAAVSMSLDICFDGRLRPRGSGHNLNKQSDQSKTADGQMSFAVFPEVGGQVLDKWRTLD